MRRAVIAAALAAAAAAAAWFAFRRPPVERRPNVLILVMDTTRGDRCSVMGYGRPTTPRLDEFAKDAVAFRNAWSPAGWTGPAHASLFTGLRCEHHGFYAGNRFFLGLEFQTIPQVFQTAGWSTACFANNGWFAPDYGLARGFDVVRQLDKVPNREFLGAHDTHALAADWAEAQARDGRPFFLFINDMEPHLPYTPPDGDAKRFLRGDPTPDEIAAARAFNFPDTVSYCAHLKELTPRQLGVLSDLYDAEIGALDHEIGALFDRLRADGLLESTIVVVAGDHGELIGEHHMTAHGFSLHAAARRVPLVVRWPGAFDGGRTVDSVVRLEDVAPTLLELCRLPALGGIDGVSLQHDLAGRISRAMQGADPDTKANLETQIAGIDATALTVAIEAVHDGRFHLLVYGDGRRELYDIARDPGELEDLAAREPAEVERLTEILRSAR